MAEENRRATDRQPKLQSCPHTSSQPENGFVVDTSGKLTIEELAELKKLASMSRIARIFVGIAMGGLALFGVDKINDFFHTVIANAK
jgi:hypothetical protein